VEVHDGYHPHFKLNWKRFLMGDASIIADARFRQQGSLMTSFSILVAL
jgi:hypothetical protein